MALTPIGMGTLFAGYGIGLTGYAWITGRDITLGQLWNPLHPVTKLPAKGTASPDVIIPDGKGGGGASTGTAQNPLGATKTASGAGGGTSTNPLSGGLSGGSSGAGAATSASGGSSGGAVLTAAETAAGGGGSSGSGTKSSGGKASTGGVRRTTTPRSSGSSGEAGIGSPSGGGGGGGNALPLPSVGGGTVTAAEVYRELLKAGATPVQAAGLLGNVQNESTFNPEAVGDSGTSFGLFQEHNKAPQSYLQTGNPQRDLVTQINFMIRNGGLKQAVGSTPAQVASNFAAGYEGCVGCQPGGSQNAQRAANAANIYAQAQRGNWGAQPAPTTGGSGKAVPGGAKPGSKAWWQRPGVLGLKSGTKPFTASQVANLFPIVRPARGRPHLAPKPKKAPARAPTGVRHNVNPALTRPAAAARVQHRVNPQSVASRY